MNELVRTQHEYDDDALDDAFEDIRADVLAREVRAYSPLTPEDARNNPPPCRFSLFFEKCFPPEGAK